MGTQNLARCNICVEERRKEELLQCSTCRPVGVHLFYCATRCSETSCNHAENCKLPGHQACWDSHIPPKGLQKHEKIDGFSDYLATLILHSETNNDLQARMHEKDLKAEWFTVNMGSIEDPEPMVQVTDRFRKLCDPRYVNARSDTEQHPSIVSFIGDTGAGKSTIVNAMSIMGQIESQPQLGNARFEQLPLDSTLRPSNLPKVEQARRNGPVTRSGNPQRASEPTSSGVHLYLDPGVNKVRYLANREKAVVPILYADCEGFGGSTNTTNAERSVQPQALRHPRRLSGSSFNSLPSRKASNAARDILSELEITLPEIKNAGKLGSELFYARFLYAFSDVVVFVTNNDQQLHKDLQALLEWAASAVHKSINHLPRRTLIVVQNMPPRHVSDYYSESFHKQSLFGSMTSIWESSSVLTDFKKRHDKQATAREGEIHSNEKFLNIFFQSVEVCYIPNREFATSTQMMRQYRILRRQIVKAVEAGQQARSTSWTRYDVPSLSHLFSRAFYHFAKLRGPFDFFLAARKDNPLSKTMVDHIANLLRYLQASSVGVDGVGPLVAVCLITFVYRNFRQAIEPTEVFNRTLRRICVKGISTYQTKYQLCAFLFPDGHRCKAVRPTHPQHCSSDEKGSTSPGTFDSANYPEAADSSVRKLEKTFIEMFKDVCSKTADESRLRLPSVPVFTQYRRQTLASAKLRQCEFWHTAKSNKTCFACLQSVPDHSLPCGHVLCEQCVQDFGQVHEDERNCMIISHCPFCFAEWPSQPQLVRFKPRLAGVRVLTLDGGGIRGVVELEILAEVERRVGLGVPMRDLFDLFVGTSTGGIIALGLAMTEYSLNDMTNKFMQISKRTFEKDRGGILHAFDPLNVLPAIFITVKAWQSKYRTTPLREGLLKLFGSDMSMFPASVSTGSQRKVRVAVTSSTDGELCLFTNYNRMLLTDQRDFEREDEQSQEAKVWEAALATSAAPIYFKLFERGRPTKQYGDGALHANLPVESAMSEVQKIWPPASVRAASDKAKRHYTSDESSLETIEALEIQEDESDDSDHTESDIALSPSGDNVHLDALVSIGTGEQERKENYPSAFEVGGLKEAYQAFIKSMDTESSWNDFKRKATYDPRSHHRLNVPITKGYVRLDDWKLMPDLIETVHECYRSSKERLDALQDTASQLTASLLYFEPNSPNSGLLQPKDRWHKIHGQIWCRLARNAPPIKALIDRIVGLGIRVDYPRREPSPYVEIPPKDGWKSEIRSGGKHFSVPVTIKTTDPNSVIEIAVSLKDVIIPEDCFPSKVRTFPISGFPVVYKDLEEKMAFQ